MGVLAVVALIIAALLESGVAIAIAEAAGSAVCRIGGGCPQHVGAVQHFGPERGPAYTCAYAPPGQSAPVGFPRCPAGFEPPGHPSPPCTYVPPQGGPPVPNAQRCENAPSQPPPPPSGPEELAGDKGSEAIRRS
jgi:hypothetical protein